MMKMIINFNLKMNHQKYFIFNKNNTNYTIIVIIIIIIITNNISIRLRSGNIKTSRSIVSYGNYNKEIIRLRFR